jgi:hypothetical protein
MSVMTRRRAYFSLLIVLGGCRDLLSIEEKTLDADAGEAAPVDASTLDDASDGAPESALDSAIGLAADADAGTCAKTCDGSCGDVTDGCDTADPLAIQPSSLKLWLKADNGVRLGADGGVGSWASSVPTDGGLLEGGLGAVVVTGSPMVDNADWPGEPGRLSVRMAIGDSFDADLSALASTSGFTLFVVDARYGNAIQCLLASHTYNRSFSCCTDQSTAFQLCTQSNTDFWFEPFCNSLHVNSGAPNTATGYQTNLHTVWFDPATPRYYYALGADAGITGNSSCGAPYCVCPNAGALTGLNVPGRIGGGYVSPGSYAGLVGEIIVYSTLLSSTDRASVRAYLQAKWKTP